MTSGDQGAPRIDTRAGVDTDQDGLADTLALPNLAAPTVAVDLDHDGLADLIVRIGVDGATHHDPLDPAGMAFLGDAAEPPLFWHDPFGAQHGDLSGELTGLDGDLDGDALCGPWLG